MTILATAKHLITEIDGKRCTLIESGVSEERMKFLHDVLSHNKLEVLVKEEVQAEGTGPVLYTVGVTDIVFNPVYAIYERKLLRPDGELVTPAWWRQLEGDTRGQYWLYGKSEVADVYE